MAPPHESAALSAARLLGRLARLRPRHVPCVPLAATVVMSELLFAVAHSRRSEGAAAPLDWGRGLSVVIPERGGGALLAECLDRLAAARAGVDEPTEVIVVVNGSPLADYAALAAAHPDVRWLHSAAPLGVTSAARRGVAAARHGAVYLLNNDMLLASEALRAAMSWRGPRVFAVASQIFFQDAARRREETGWTSMALENALPVPRHETPWGAATRGTVWAGAGSALFHARLLRELLEDSSAFDPFYWEDVDLGVRAWRQGYEVLFCPASVAWHRHRATVERYFDPVDVARIFDRNRLLFQLRNPFPRQDLRATVSHILGLDPATRRELGSWQSCLQLWRTRWRAFRAPQRDLDYASMRARCYRQSTRPTVVVVSPFAVLPPAHGGAVRTLRLATELARAFDVVLLSDEGDRYGEANDDSYPQFSSVYLVRGRPEEVAGTQPRRIARIRSHSHEVLKDELRAIVAQHQPLAVLVEHVELAGLVEVEFARRPPFILSLQDVLLQPDDRAQREADEYELRLIDRFDGRVVCSAEDQVLLGKRESRLIPNGVDLSLTRDYNPSRDRREILCVGPFRAPNNWQGILDFLERAYPEVEAAVPGVRLTIVGGLGACVRAATAACFERPSITVLEYVADLQPLLEACAVTINPQSELRGSSLKVIESLAAGRACVSTRAGARGWLKHGFRGLVAVPAVEDFAAPLIRLLNEDAYRLSLEAPDEARLAGCSWEAAGRELSDYVEEVVARRGHS